MSTFQPLFTVEETLGRLGQSKSKGCILVFNAREAIHIFVKEGNIISASGGEKSMSEAVDHALGIADPSYRWIPDAEPSQVTMKLSIVDYVAARSNMLRVDFGQTGIADGAYVPPYGWSFSNLHAELTPQ